MALIKCSECQKEISDRAKFCPNCGCRSNGISVEEKKKIKKYILAGIGIIVAVILIAVIYDACTVSTDELRDDLRKSKQELEEIENEIDDLEEQKRKNDWLINYYESQA